MKKTDHENIVKSKIIHSQLQQLISNLQQLDKLSEILKENVMNLEIDLTCQLSVVWKRKIAYNFIFFSVTSDNNFKIMTVCVEKHHNSKEITIWVALNTEDLLVITEKFVKFVRVLKYAAQQD